MEDATDISWSSAKASHTVLLCEMERGSLDWENTDRIDRIRTLHAQKHVSHQKTSWQKNENKQRSWFCKFYQNGTCQFSTDHEVGGRIHKHVCAYCLNSGKQLSHLEKDCMRKKKKQVQKRASSCSPVRWSSTTLIADEITKTTDKACRFKYEGNDPDKKFRTPMFYNSQTLPTEVDSLLAKSSRVACKAMTYESQLEVKSRTFVNSTRSNHVQSEHGFKPLDRRGK